MVTGACGVQLDMHACAWAHARPAPIHTPGPSISTLDHIPVLQHWTTSEYFNTGLCPSTSTKNNLRIKKHLINRLLFMKLAVKDRMASDGIKLPGEMLIEDVCCFCG